MNWKLRYLEARDARQQAVNRLLGPARPGDAASLLLLSANIPGEEKHRPGVARLLRNALSALTGAIGLKGLLSGRDLLGPFHIGRSNLPPAEAKRIAVAIEAENPAGRLVDVDVYRPDGSQLDRAALGLSPRACLLCSEPARECILLQRHSTAELLERVDSLLRPLAPVPTRVAPEALAVNLRVGALCELDLTPKPGLVDLRDNGCHPDLCYADMRASVELLPRYFEEVLACHRRQAPLEDYVRAGIEAENRMRQQIHSNAHKGFIFLAGVVLMAACRCDGQVARLSPAVADIAGSFFAHFASHDSHGASIRKHHGIGGLRGEAEQGLPAVFEHGWPKYREALDANWDSQDASFYLMATLMQRVEDTTAIHRCGLEGLHRLRRDGAHLQRLLEEQQAPEPMLASLNEEYRRSGLTMGGVADCMALTFALQESASYS